MDPVCAHTNPCARTIWIVKVMAALATFLFNVFLRLESCSYHHWYYADYIPTGVLKRIL